MTDNLRACLSGLLGGLLVLTGVTLHVWRHYLRSS